MNQKNFNQILCIILSVVLMLLTGCHFVDDQTIIKPQDKTYGDPAPTQRDFAQINKNHKVLLAVIDSGVDYNHPLLKNSIHFALDPNGAPKGFGYDYVANDAWGSPYIVRTSTDYVAKDENHIKDVFIARYIAAGFEYLSLEQPRLANFFESRRNVAQEIDGETFHGTHVAGLMVYDKPSFGLMAYRILPLNDLRHGGMARSGEDSNDILDRALISAIDQAVKDGARVINMSLGMTFKKADSGFSTNMKRAEKLRGTIEKYPSVLFVAAAGNDSTWVDNQTSFSMPCGLKVKNQLCVGAVGNDDHLASFTNIPLENVDLVFSLGVDVISTFPTKMCNESYLDSDLKAQAASSWDHRPANQRILQDKIEFTDLEKNQLKEMAVKFAQTCIKHKGLEKLSGTSMATPFVSRIAGEILEANPTFTAADVIHAIKSRAKASSVGPLPISILQVPKPSWYPSAIPNVLGKVYSQDGTPDTDSDENNYFQFKVISR